MRKKILSAGMAALLAAALVACGGGNDPNVDSPAAGDEIVPAQTTESGGATAPGTGTGSDTSTGTGTGTGGSSTTP
jgi:hypothetical protein